MVRVTHLYASYRQVLHTASLLLIKGIMQRQDEVINVLAHQVVPWPRLERVYD